MPLSRTAALDAAAIRRDYPLLRQHVHGKPLAYLDNAATTQKPQVVIDRLTHYYVEENANVHRGLHWLSERATHAFEEARATVARFLNADARRDRLRSRHDRGDQPRGRHVRALARRPGDEIVISAMEHHSNIVPWQILCEQQGAQLRIIPITDVGELDLDAYAALLTDRTRLVAVVHVSNALGTVNPIGEIVRARAPARHPGTRGRRAGGGARCGRRARAGVRFLRVLGSQDLRSDRHRRALRDVGAARVDAAVSERRRHDPLGLVRADPVQRPAAPVRSGTPDIAGAVGLAAAIGYLTGIGFDRIAGYERELLEYATGALRDSGRPRHRHRRDKVGVLSFVVDGVHPHDVATILDREGVAIRAGHHCCQPLMERLGVPATARASLALYNNHDDIDALSAALQTVRGLFG